MGGRKSCLLGEAVAARRGAAEVHEDLKHLRRRGAAVRAHLSERRGLGAIIVCESSGAECGVYPLREALDECEKILL